MHLERLEEATGWDAICTADRDPDRAKPAPTLYLEALEQLGLATDESVAFEDSPNGVLAAKAAGVFCVAIPNEVTRELGLEEAGADLVLDSLADLPPAALFAHLAKE
jgi:beta-phosphoglucomutase-like phosphatase (HAD superfamily)